MCLGTLLPFERVCQGALKRAAMKPKPTFHICFNAQTACRAKLFFGLATQGPAIICFILQHY